MLKPTQDYILVRPVLRKQSDVLHVISNEKYTQGIVVAAGPGKTDHRGRLWPLTVKPGDFITYGDLDRGYDFYPKYEENGEVFRILQEADIAFIADPDNEAHQLPADQIAKLVSESRVLEVA